MTVPPTDEAHTAVAAWEREHGADAAHVHYCVTHGEPLPDGLGRDDARPLA